MCPHCIQETVMMVASTITNMPGVMIGAMCVCMGGIVKKYFG